jgi:exopolysaccharide production protein ExoQ
MTREDGYFAEDSGALLVGTGLPFIVGLFFSFRLFIMLLSVRIFGTEPQTGTGISLALNFLLLVVVAFQSFGAADYAFRSMLKLSSVRWVLLFLIFSCLSLFWSVAASLSAAIAYWCAMAADVATVILLLRTGSTTDSVHSLMKGYVWGACALAIVAWLLPAQSDLRLGDEELLGANNIGYLCALAFFFAQYLLHQKVGRYGIAAIVLGVTLLRSLSKTTIVAFVLAEGFLLLRDKSMSGKTKLLLLSSAALVGIAFSSLLVSYFDIYSNTGNSPETLTGRLGIWAFILDEAIKEPWLGHGFYSVWKVIPPFGEFEARHAHNELIQQFYLYGVAGIFLMAGLYGSFYRQARRFATGSLKIFFYSLLLFILIRGLAESEPYDFSLPLWAIIMFTLLLERTDATVRETIEISPREQLATI